MKKKQQNIARELRSRGCSIYEIMAVTKCAKSSVSVWVRDIVLTEKQKKRLSKKGHTFDAIEKRRATRLENGRRYKEGMLQEAIAEVGEMTDRDLFFFGVAAYWGEGSKRKPGSVEFFNSDPKFIKIMMQFFLKICEVPKGKFKGRVQIHAHLDPKKAEKYWSRISGIPRKQFQTTAQQVNKASKGQKDTLPLGTFMIGVYDTKLMVRIFGWMEGVCRQVSISSTK